MSEAADIAWDNFLVPSVFETIQRGKRLKRADQTNGPTPYVSSTACNNGVDGFIGKTRRSRTFTNCISLANSGSVGTAFYEPFEYVASDHVTCLKSAAFSMHTYLFLACTIEKQSSNFNFNREINDTRINRMQIMLPVADDGKPDYEYMEQYSQQKREAMLEKYRTYAEGRIAELGDYADIPELSDKQWGKFRAFGDGGLLKIAATSSGVDSIRLNTEAPAKEPYITRTATCNGIARFVSKSNYEHGFDDAGCITIGLDTQTAFYQPHNFITGQNIQIVTGEQLNEDIALFLVTILRTQMKAKFNWGGNGATLGRLVHLDVLLPTTDSGEPDYDYMEQYIKNMRLQKYQQYLDFLSGQEHL